ncbi:MAG: homoserine dehydrogenase [bacterium]
MPQINLGILGLGTVGSGVVKLIQEHADLLSKKIGASLCIKKIADLNLESPRGIKLDRSLLTTDGNEVVEDKEIQIVVELIGGIEAARDFSLKALRNGKHLVTANKALLALHGQEIYWAAAQNKVNLGFEASVCGGIPILRSLREGLVANRIQLMMGIINGTANYILTQMSEEGRDFASALAEAQEKGYAEADPTFDVEGYDSAHKLQILSSIAYGGYVDFDRIYVEGISSISPLDIKYAREFGYKIKLLAIAKESKGRLEVRVHPTLIPEHYILASVGGVFNAVYMKGDAVGPLLFYGQGAGQMPTASAVVSDIMEIAQDILSGRPSRSNSLPLRKAEEAGIQIMDISEARSRYYMRVSALDKPGVLSRVSGILGDHHISIASVIQKERHAESSVPVVMMTHEAREGDARGALKEIDQLEVITAETICIRVDGE